MLLFYFDEGSMITHILLGLLVLLVFHFAAYFGVMGFVRYAILTYEADPAASARLPELLRKVQMLAAISRIPVVNIVMGVALFGIWALSILSREAEVNRRILQELEKKVGS